MSTSHRIGLIVPSSNVTMETELPVLFARTSAATGHRFSFHSARMRMTSVTPEALAAMNAQGERCAAELADAECDVLAYACLVAVMVSGPGAHQRAEADLRAAAGGIPVETSAGALIEGIRALNAERVAMIAPYAPPLTATVVAYLADAGIHVVDAISLNITDNSAVGRLDPLNPLGLIERLDLRRAEALVVSACVQMPSLASVEAAQELTGLPTLSAATATAATLLHTLDLPRLVRSSASHSSLRF
jgi:maleate isomerase